MNPPSKASEILNSHAAFLRFAHSLNSIDYEDELDTDSPHLSSNTESPSIFAHSIIPSKLQKIKRNISFMLPRSRLKAIQYALDQYHSLNQSINKLWKETRLILHDPSDCASASQVAFSFMNFESQVFDVGRLAIISCHQILPVHVEQFSDYVIPFTSDDMNSALISKSPAKELMQTSPSLDHLFNADPLTENELHNKLHRATMLRKAQLIAHHSQRLLLHHLAFASYLRISLHSQKALISWNHVVQWLRNDKRALATADGHMKNENVLNEYHGTSYLYNPSNAGIDSCLASVANVTRHGFSLRRHSTLFCLVDDAHFLLLLHHLLRKKRASIDTLLGYLLVVSARGIQQTSELTVVCSLEMRRVQAAINSLPPIDDVMEVINNRSDIPSARKDSQEAQNMQLLDTATPKLRVNCLSVHEGILQLLSPASIASTVQPNSDISDEQASLSRSLSVQSTSSQLSYLDKPDDNSLPTSPSSSDINHLERKTSTEEYHQSHDDSELNVSVSDLNVDFEYSCESGGELSLLIHSTSSASHLSWRSNLSSNYEIVSSINTSDVDVDDSMWSDDSDWEWDQTHDDESCEVTDGKIAWCIL